MVSIVAWFWCGYEYVASIRRGAAAMAARASPTALPTAASRASRPSFSDVANDALEAFALSPKSHSIGRAARAVFACHHVSATTATADSPVAWPTTAMPGSVLSRAVRPSRTAG